MPVTGGMLVDVNANGTAGAVQPKTLAWVEAQLQAAQQAGARVIAVSHQPALVHNGMFTAGYVMHNHADLLALYEMYGVALNLCGHLHMQHMARVDGLLEVAASSLAVSPHQYGVLCLDGTQLVDYRMQPLDVAAWAARAGRGCGAAGLCRIIRRFL